MKAEDYRGGWKVIGAIRDAARGPMGLTAAGDADAEEHMARFPADVLFTDLGVLVLLKGDELRQAELPTTLSYESGNLAPEQVQRASESILYDEVRDVQLKEGKPPGRIAAKFGRTRPETRVWITKTRLRLPVVVVELHVFLLGEEVRQFLQRTPLAQKIK